MIRPYFWPTICIVTFLMAGCASAPARDGHKNRSPEQPAGSVAPSGGNAAAPAPVIERSSAAPATIVAVPQTTLRDVMDDDAVLAYAKQFGELPADKQAKEYARIMQSLNRDKKNVRNRLKAVIALSVPESRNRDIDHALAMLAELQREKGLDEDVDGLISLLKSQLEERQRLEANALGLSQKLKDEQRRADELQKKLDELKNIEKTMIERSRGTQP